MDTNPRTGRAYKRGPYKRHPAAFKRAEVEASFAPGASVSRVAREHDINANQVFLWRKLHQDGLLGGDEPALLPVHIDASARSVHQFLGGHYASKGGSETQAAAAQ
jgi:transposase